MLEACTPPPPATAPPLEPGDRMWLLDRLQNEWMMLIIGGGIASTLALILVYVAAWQQPPRGEKPDAAPRGLAWIRSFLPWILVVTWMGLMTWGLAYMMYHMHHPPNW